VGAALQHGDGYEAAEEPDIWMVGGQPEAGSELADGVVGLGAGLT
jgi:hypothetical protein